MNIEVDSILFNWHIFCGQQRFTVAYPKDSNFIPKMAVSRGSVQARPSNETMMAKETQISDICVEKSPKWREIGLMLLVTISRKSHRPTCFRLVPVLTTLYDLK